MSALDTLIKQAAPAGTKNTSAPSLPSGSSRNTSSLDSLIAASKPGAAPSGKSKTYIPTAPFTPKVPDFNAEDATTGGIIKNTIKGLPGAALKEAKDAGNYLLDTAGGIIAPGITHDEIRNPTIIKDTVLGIPKSIYKLGKQAVTHPIDTAQAAVGGAARGVADFVTNAIVNLTPEKVTGVNRDDLHAAVKETLDKYLDPDFIKKKSGDTAVGEGFHAGGQVAPLIGLAETGMAGAGAIGAPAIAGEAAGFVAGGQTQVPLDASIKDRAKQAMQDLVGLGLFKLGTYTYMKARGQIESAIQSKVSDAGIKYAEDSFGSSGHDLDRAIEAGDMPVETVYKNKAGELQPKYADHVISDLAGKMDDFHPGLGDQFKAQVDLSNPTPTSLDTQALDFFKKAVSGGGEAVDVVSTRESAQRASGKPPLPTRSGETGPRIEKTAEPAANLDALIEQAKPKGADEPIKSDVSRETPAKPTDIVERMRAEKQPGETVLDAAKRLGVETEYSDAIKAGISQKIQENGGFDMSKADKPVEKVKAGEEPAPKAPEAPIVEKKTTTEKAVVEKPVIESKKSTGPNLKDIPGPKTPDEAKILKPIGSGETKTSKLALNIEQNAIEKGFAKKFGDLPEYKTVDLKDQAKLAGELLKKDADLAMKIALGDARAPKDLLPEMVLDAVERAAIKSGDVETLRALSRSKLTTEATAMGQRIRALAERDQDSPVKAMQDVVKSREDAVKRKNKGKDISELKKKAVDDIKSEIKKASPKKQDWQSFIKSIEC